MVNKYKMAHARQCMVGGCRNKNSDLYSKRSSKYDGALYICPECAAEIGLLNYAAQKTESSETSEVPEEPKRKRAGK